MRKEIENWYLQSERDLISAENALNSGDFYASVFWC
jgi:HEPN domain-containing protein